MFGLFQSFFGFERAGRYPESLVAKAIERAVDGTDPLLRGLFNYKRKLRPSVLRAMDHVIDIVDGLEPPIVLNNLNYDADPRLKSFFVSSRQMQQVLTQDPELQSRLKGFNSASNEVVMLLVMDKVERGGFGADRVGEMILHDVPQVTVSFENHVLRDATDHLSETLRLLKRRAFDHLLSLALASITLACERRTSLQRRQKLLQSKIDLLGRGNWGFERSADPEIADQSHIEAQLHEIEAELLKLGGDDSVFEMNLGLVSDILGRPEEWLWAKKIDLIVDDMGIKRTQPGSMTHQLVLDEISNASGRQVVVALLSIPTKLLRETLRP